MKTIDVTPTWGEWGNIFYRFAQLGKRKAVEALHPDLAKALAAAQALSAIQKSLNDEQNACAQAVMASELHKQGF